VFEDSIEVRFFGSRACGYPPLPYVFSVTKNMYISCFIQSYSRLYPSDYTVFKQEGVEPIRWISEGSEGSLELQI
jgi:hypothetical protein